MRLINVQCTVLVPYPPGTSPVQQVQYACRLAASGVCSRTPTLTIAPVWSRHDLFTKVTTVEYVYLQYSTLTASATQGARWLLRNLALTKMHKLSRHIELTLFHQE